VASMAAAPTPSAARARIVGVRFGFISNSVCLVTGRTSELGGPVSSPFLPLPLQDGGRHLVLCRPTSQRTCHRRTGRDKRVSRPGQTPPAHRATRARTRSRDFRSRIAARSPATRATPALGQEDSVAHWNLSAQHGVDHHAATLRRGQPVTASRPCNADR
jgi:hypothetical protein